MELLILEFVVGVGSGNWPGPAVKPINQGRRQVWGRRSQYQSGACFPEVPSCRGLAEVVPGAVSLLQISEAFPPPPFPSTYLLPILQKHCRDHL